MKISDLFENEARMEWRFSPHNHDGTPEYVLFTDYGNKKKTTLEYTATFVFGYEDHFKFYQQGTLAVGDHIEFGSKRTTPQKEFYSMKDLNKFLEAHKMPPLSEKELNKLHPDDVIFIGIKEITDHFFRASLDDLAEFKKQSKSFEDFLEIIRKAIKKLIRKNNWFMSANKFRPQTEHALKAYYDDGVRLKPTI